MNSESSIERPDSDLGKHLENEINNYYPANCGFNVVGVGASAGGLEAIEKLFAGMPEDTGAAFVVVQHLSPDFKSHMQELLARKTSLVIKRVTNEMPVEPNTIYLIPPNTEMVIANGQLLLTERDREEALNLPIDHFLRSLANDCGRNAIGIILSGTGSDGSRGIVNINEVGGLVLCQDEDSAKFDGMPVSAQQTNAVHLVLPPEDMANLITTYIEQSLSPEELAEQELVVTNETGIDEIFKLLRRDHNIDFSLYKPTTVIRRIDRRITLGKYKNIEAYAESLGSDPEELHSLYKDLLIGVTQFFRDRAAFEIIEKEIIPRIIEKKKQSPEGIRVWVAGCATGQEAYSIAIAFYEALEGIPNPPSVKIFATDIHRKSLQTASVGIYPEESFGEFDPERLSRFFNKRVDGYEIIPEIRKLIVFAPHDVANDAPFTRLDLVTCRNLLIYLLPAVQKKVISLFHFSLRTGAYMFIGPSETPGDLGDEFEVDSTKWRIYRKRRDVRLTNNLKLPLSGAVNIRPFNKLGRPVRPTPESQLLATYDQLLDKFMSPSFLVDERGELMHSFGGAERFLQFRGGRVSTNILQVIHEDLKTSVAGALQHSAKENKSVRYTGIRVNTTKGVEHVRLLVFPFHDSRTEITNTLITIEPIEKLIEPPTNLDADIDVSKMARSHISTLENELRYTKENLQATVEELETSNEELQATNEELVASNEEMQSTNEELQSVNEELYTVNHEYQRKIGELTEMTDDMNNLFQSTDVGVIFLDNDLKVRRFTPKIAETFNLLPQDVGRPIENFSHSIIDKQVHEELKSVLATEERLDREVVDQQGNNWLLRILPYRTQLKVEGVVLTLVDINSVKKSDAKLRQYRNIIESSVEAIIGLDLDGTIRTWNRGAAALYGYAAEEAVGQSLSMLTPEDELEHEQQWIRAAAAGSAVNRHETIRITKAGTELNVMLVISPVYDTSGDVTGLSLITHDFTQQKLAEAEEIKLASIVETTTDFVGICDTDGNTLSLNPAARKMLGLPDEFKVEGNSVSNWQPPEHRQMIVDEVLPVASTEGQWRGTLAIVNRDGNQIPLSSIVVSHKNDHDEVDYFFVVGRDNTKQLEFEKELKDREKFLRRTLDGLYTFAGVLTIDGILLEANRPSLMAANVKAEEVIGVPFPETYWWAYSEEVQDRLWSAIESAAAGNEVRYDETIRLAGEHLIIIDFQLTPLRNDEGEVTHLIPSGIDITQRVALEAQSRVFRRAFDSSLTAMVITDPNQKDNPIIYANPGFETLTGYKRDFAIGKNCRFLQGPDTDTAAVEKVRSAIGLGKSVHQKLLNYRKDGTEFWNELVITPVFDESGKATHFIGVQFDMTQHQAAELKLSRARDVAEAANAAKSSFVANMSHEIRTPLTTVVGMTEMLLEQESDKSKHDTLQMIHQSGNHLVKLVNDILDMSKIEAGKLEFDSVQVSPMKVIEDVAASMRYKANDKGLKFSLQYKGLLPEFIQTDPVRFRQVLFNLTGNAIKFTEQGSVTLRCELMDRDNNPKLRIEVADTGIGFKKGEVDLLFEQFTQVDASPTRRQGGSGLGLYISRRIAEMLGGKLSAASAFGTGSCFKFELSTGDLSQQTMIDPNALAAATTTHRAARQSDSNVDGKILVIEDTFGIQVLLRRMLERAGAYVEVAEDGRAAIEKYFAQAETNSRNNKTTVASVNDFNFDLILLDMHMPRLSGYDTATEIRKLGIKTPIIALTASAMRGDREKCLEAGCDDYLTKPIDREKLMEKVKGLIKTNI